MFSFLNFIYIFIYILSNSNAPFPLYRQVILGHRFEGLWWSRRRALLAGRWHQSGDLCLIRFISSFITQKQFNKQKWLVWHLDIWSDGWRKANNTFKLDSVPQQGFDHCFHQVSKWSLHQSLMIFCIRWIFNNGFIQKTKQCHCYSYLQLRDFSPAQAE